MIEIELKPTLSSCIQTIAKREYNHALRRLLKEEAGNKALEEKLELLKHFLESADFRELRRQHEKLLCDGEIVTFKLRFIDGHLEYGQV